MKDPVDIPIGRQQSKDGFFRRLSAKKLWTWLYVIAAGALVGTQFYNPSKRVIEAIAGLVIVGILWNFSILGAIWILMVVYPYPFAISIGNSNFVFVIIIFIIYLIRVSSGQLKIHSDKLLNIPTLLLVLAYIISFYNMEMTTYKLRWGLIHTANFFAILLLYYMIINFVDDEKKLLTMVRMFMIAAGLIVFISFLEMLFPNKQIIPSLIYSEHKRSLVMKGVRIKGPFHDYELLAEFFAMMVPIVFFMIIRTGRLVVRMMYTLLLLLVMFMQFATITRGAFVSLMIGVVYLAFISRRELGFVRLVILVGVGVVVMFAIDTFMANYTISGSLFERMIGTTFEKGVIPDTRMVSWSGAVERWLEHPLIGHGPGWDFSVGIEGRLWPHNAYLNYMNMIGVFGLLAFLMLLYRLLKVSFLGLGHSIINAPFPYALMKVLHVSLVIFIIDMIKVDFQRNNTYTCFVWLFFALIASTYYVIQKSKEGSALPEYRFAQAQEPPSLA